MSQDSDLVQYVPARGAIEPVMVDAGAEQQQPENPLKKVHSLLRGRYWLAILLAVVGAGIGAAVGYKAQAPLYTSTGMIRVQPYLPHILYETEQNGVMPMFDAFVGSQVELMQGQRVTDLAMQNPEWVAIGRGLEPAAIVEFRASLTVVRPKGSSLILVQFEDGDREAARAAVKSVIQAYDELYGEKSDKDINGTIAFLETRSEMLARDLKAKNEAIFGIANELGSSAVESMYTFKLGELNKLEAELRRAELSVAIAKGARDAAAGAGEGENAGLQPGAMTAEALAMQLPRMNSLLEQRRRLELQVKLSAARLGDAHPNVKDLKNQIAVFSGEIDDLVTAYNEGMNGGEGASDILAQAGGGVSLLDQLLAEERNVRTLYEQARQETQDLGRKGLQIDALRAEASDFRQKLDEAKGRLESLLVERNVGGRVSIESEGDRPLAPSKDKRTQFAAAGAMGMAGLGVGSVMLLGLMNSRIRDLHDVIEGPAKTSRVLGVLPHLPDDLEDPEQALLAAHSVHQIRTSLHGRHGTGGSVFAVTSPSPSSGKTSLSVALGLSFASSRSRTLLIDCDIVGGGLTSKMKHVTRRRIGHILRRKGVITSAQLVEAVKVRLGEDEPLGQILVRLGYATPEDIDSAMEAQRGSRVGLREALNGESIQECLAETGITGLFLLPLGSAQRQHASELSFASLSRVIQQVRQWFDVIIIDTGPALGSLEASVAAMVADQVVMTVTRGESRANLQQSIELMRMTGTELAGIVLNRASAPDMLTSNFSSSISRRSSNGSSTYVLPERLPVIEHKNLHLGPIGTAVAAMSQVAYEDETLN